MGSPEYFTVGDPCGGFFFSLARNALLELEDMADTKSPSPPFSGIEVLGYCPCFLSLMEPLPILLFF
jgi:hypothetical protein